MNKNNPTLGARVNSRATIEIEGAKAEINEISTEDSRFDAYLKLTMRLVADIYSESNPTAGANSYLEDFLRPIIQSSLDPYAVLRGESLDFPKTIGQPDIYRPLIATILFCNMAKNIHRYGDHEGAWTMLAEASFWCGCASAGDKMYDLSKMAASETTRARLRGGEQSEERKLEEVVQIFKDKAPQGVWASCSAAAKFIQKALIDRIENGEAKAFPKLSGEESGQRTISSYIQTCIKNDPELGKLIEKEIKPGRPKKPKAHPPQ